MGKKKTMPAVKMKAKKAKKLSANLHCTIPAPKPRKHTKVFDNHGDELDFTLEMLSDYRAIASARRKITRKTSKKPWYMLTKTELKPFYKLTIFEKMTKDKFAIQETKYLLKMWEKNNPMPQKELNGTTNAFYAQEITEWEKNRQDAWAHITADIHEKRKLGTSHLYGTVNKETKVIDVSPKLAKEKLKAALL